MYLPVLFLRTIHPIPAMSSSVDKTAKANLAALNTIACLMRLVEEGTDDDTRQWAQTTCSMLREKPAHNMKREVILATQFAERARSINKKAHPKMAEWLETAPQLFKNCKKTIIAQGITTNNTKARKLLRDGIPTEKDRCAGTLDECEFVHPMIASTPDELVAPSSTQEVETPASVARTSVAALALAKATDAILTERELEEEMRATIRTRERETGLPYYKPWQPPRSRSTRRRFTLV